MTPGSSPEKKTWPFGAATKKDWEEAAQLEWDVSKTSTKSQLVHDETEINAYYDRSDLLSQSGSQLPVSTHAAFGARAWLNMPLVPVKHDQQANELALAWLNSGADGIVFELSDESEPETLLAGIDLRYCAVSFFAEPTQKTFFQKLLTFVKSKEYQLPSITGAVVWKTSPESLLDLAQPFIPCRNFQVAGIFSEEKPSPEDEISSLLAKAVKQIDTLVFPEGGKLEINDALHSIAFSVSLGSDFFLEIIKLKTLRMLWQQIARSYLPEYTSSVFIQGVSKAWSKPEFEPHSNLLKSTTSAMSAVLGGCDAITLQADDFNGQGMTRITRNISSILREESGFSKVADPTAGSYYLENQIDRLAQSTWKKFQEQV